jgi:hypothetical protein
VSLYVYGRPVSRTSVHVGMDPNLENTYWAMALGMVFATLMLLRKVGVA